MRALRGDDLGQFVEGRVGLVDHVGWADPDAVADADIAMVRQQLPDLAAGMPGGAAGAAVLRLMAVGQPVGFGPADLDDGAGQPFLGNAGDGGEQVRGDEPGRAGGDAGAADLLPEFAEWHAVQGGQPGDVGDGGLVACGRDRDGQTRVHQALAAAVFVDWRVRWRGGLGRVARSAA